MLLIQLDLDCSTQTPHVTLSAARKSLDVQTAMSSISFSQLILHQREMKLMNIEDGEIHIVNDLFNNVSRVTAVQRDTGEKKIRDNTRLKNATTTSIFNVCRRCLY